MRAPDGGSALRTHWTMHIHDHSGGKGFDAIQVVWSGLLLIFIGYI